MTRNALARRIPPAAVLTVGLGALLPLSSAQAASNDSVSSGSRYCAMVLGQQRNSSGESVVLDRSCSTTSAAEAKSGLKAAASAHLMTYYSDAGYRQGDHYDVYGSAGTCDYAGYAFTVTGYWSTHMSAIEGNGNCTLVQLTNRDGYESAGRRLPTSFGGTIYNDNVVRVEVYRG